MSILQNLQENVVETAEQMIKVVEEGVAILTGTQMSENTFEDTPTSDYDQSGDDDFTMGEEEDLANMRSPLDGITEGVLGDLMKNQVCIIFDRYIIVHFCKDSSYSQGLI